MRAAAPGGHRRRVDEIDCSGESAATAESLRCVGCPHHSHVTLDSYRTAYQRIEYGQNITLKMLARVANALGVSPANLFDESRRGT